MANTLFPNAHGTDGQNHSQTAHTILDEIIFRGNRLAEARKTELANLEGIFQELRMIMEQRGFRTLSLSLSGSPEPGQMEASVRVPVPAQGQAQGDSQDTGGGNGGPNNRNAGNRFSDDISVGANISETAGRSRPASSSPAAATSRTWPGTTGLANTTNTMTAAEHIGPKTATEALSMPLAGGGDGTGLTPQPSPAIFPLTPSGGGGDAVSSNLDFLDTIGISSHEFLSIVDQIGNHE